MMRRTASFFVVLAGAGALLAACSKSDAPAPESTPVADERAASDQPADAAAPDTGAAPADATPPAGDAAGVQLSPKRRDQQGRAKIVGGKNARANLWPWIVAIGEGNRTKVASYCSGTIIAPEWVLTGAHCEVLAGDFAVVGRIDLSTNAGEIVKIVEVINHPDFVKATYDSDVALLKLEKAITGITPVPMVDPSGAAMTRAGDEWIAGWGQLGVSRADLPDFLQEVKVTISRDDTCIGNYRAINRLITPNMFCARGDLIENATDGSVADACHGDSGGPIISFDRDDENPILLGVISKGAGCADPAYPGIYARLSKFRCWVDARAGTCVAGSSCEACS